MIKQTNNNLLSKRVDSVGFISREMIFAWTRLLIWSLQLPKNPYMVFAMRLNKLWRVNGPTFLVLYLKECTRIVQAYISGNKVSSTDKPISLKGGLPAIIPGTLRTLMRSRDLECFRGVLSVLAVYRVISIPGKAKIESILGPFEGQCPTLPSHEIRIGTTEIFSRKRDYTLKPVSLLFLGTAGPNHSPSIFGIWKDLKAWGESPLFPVLVSYLHRVPGGKDFLDLILPEIERLKDLITDSGKPLILGKLSEKNEAAGKVRIFAITDSITQSVLAPLHHCIFKILKRLPMDGTFNQNGPVEHLRNLHKDGLLDGQTFYSYDLSSATDRLPIDLQVQVLGELCGHKLANLWASLLRDREWYYKGKPFKYAVGQPMGALSSWAMLALTHHTIVRIAANRVGLPDFSHYALLGDDIVIANDAVAKSYHHIMTKVLGVEINLAKSMVSLAAFEFAKRIITLEGEVSPVGPKNLLVGLKTMKGIPSILLDLVNKGLVLSEESVTNLYRSIPTVRKSQLERLMWLVKGPFGFIPTTEGLSAGLQLYDSLSVVCIDRLADSIDEAIYLHNKSLWLRNIKKMDDLYGSFRLLELVPGFPDFDLSGSDLYSYILSRYWDMAMELIASEPSKPDYSNGFGILKIRGPGFGPRWKIPVMQRLTEKIREDPGATVLPLDPFRVDRTILPLSHSTKSEVFWRDVKDIIVKRSSFRFSGK